MLTNILTLQILKLIFNNELYEATNLYLTKLKKYYRILYNTADKLQDEEKLLLTKTPELKENFLKLKNDYTNEDLERFLRNKNNFFSNKIIEYDGQLWQKTDPIFQDPDHSFITAHFFSPVKNIFSQPVSTYTINTIVIWIFNIVLFISLQYRLLPKLFNLGFFVTSNIKTKRKKTD